ncbi:MAG: type III-B CRISPR module-associated protein Cmr5 [Polyangia bacterium]
MPQTLDQRRAKHAWEAVKRAKGWGNSQHGKEYGGHAKKLPMRIRSAGLGQALAFLMAKAGKPKSKEYKKHIAQLHDDVTDWVLKHRGVKGKQPGSLLKSIIEGDSDFLRLATDEAMAYLQWLNRFGEAEGLKDDGSN